MGEEEKGSVGEGENNGATAITVASQGLGQAVGDLLVKYFGPIAEAKGQNWASQYRAKQKANLEAILPKAAQKAEAAGAERVRPPMSVAILMIEKASLEDDAFMQEKWASLLAASVNPALAGKVRKGFSQIVSELEPLDVKVLDLLYDDRIRSPRKLEEIDNIQTRLAEHLKAEKHDIMLALDNLLRTGLCQRIMDSLYISALGVDFVECCRA